MYVCTVCHRKLCNMNHILFTWAPCGVCGKNTECVDCVMSRSVDPPAHGASLAVRKINVWMYRNVKEIEYPRKKT